MVGHALVITAKTEDDFFTCPHFGINGTRMLKIRCVARQLAVREARQLAVREARTSKDPCGLYEDPDKLTRFAKCLNCEEGKEVGLEMKAKFGEKNASSHNAEEAKVRAKPAKKVCILQGCDRTVYARDLCHKDYQRWRRGDPAVCAILGPYQKGETRPWRVDIVSANDAPANLDLSEFLKDYPDTMEELERAAKDNLRTPKCQAFYYILRGLRREKIKGEGRL